jgi:hypothetical protein
MTDGRGHASYGRSGLLVTSVRDGQRQHRQIAVSYNDVDDPTKGRPRMLATMKYAPTNTLT